MSGKDVDTAFGGIDVGSDASAAASSPASQLSGQIKSVKGAGYEAIGKIVSSDPSSSWKTEGKLIREEGEKELSIARENAKEEAAASTFYGKLQSGFGALTGNQETLSAGNMQVEKAEWKKAQAEGGIPIPVVSVERMKGKIESALGMATGDIEKQKAGNLRAEKAAWMEENAE